MSEIKYYINGVELSLYSVYISSSDGLISRPKPKEVTSQSWPDHHGEVVDLTKKVYSKRVIKLNCFIEASSKEDFLTKMNNFMCVFDRTGTLRLMVIVDINRPLIYEVYLSGAIEPDKKWNKSKMVGTFQLELTEPSPIKRVVRFAGANGQISINTTKTVDIYWGDGTTTLDVSGNISANHSYAKQGIYYAIIAGNIDEITSFTTTGTVLWSKL